MKNFKKTAAFLMSVCLLLGMTACKSEETETAAPPAKEDKPVILTVSFGTSYNDSREKTIGAVEKAMQEAYPEYEVRRAFTSQIIIDKLNERDNLKIDNVDEAMARLLLDGVKDVVVQPTHIMEGFEYNDVKKEITQYADKFHSLRLGSALLNNEEDYDALANIMANETAEFMSDDTAIVWMGHGTEHSANSTYAKLQKCIDEKGIKNMFVGTVEAEPSLEDVISMAKDAGVSKVILQPLMIVAGDHANNDMAGDEEGSWKTEFQKAGFDVTCSLRGLGEIEGVRNLIIKHAGEAANVIPPVTADMLNDGTYNISVKSSSPMFNITNCCLTVSDGKMTALMTMSGKGYGKVFMGTGEEALAADENAFIPDVPNEEGLNTFSVPVKALNADTDCAAWSKKKEAWYDRTLVFMSDELPEEAFK